LRDALPPYLAGIGDRRDRAMVQALSYGVIRFHSRLERVLDQLLDRPLRASEVRLRSLILAGLFQISSMKTPDHAAVSATVSAAAAIGRPRAKGLVNAVLRRYLREREPIDALVAADPSARYAHPQWIIDRLRHDWPDEWERILAANNEPPPMWLRVNSSRVDRAAYVAQLGDRRAAAGTVAPESVLLETPVDVAELEGFAEGLVSVQDAAAQLAAHLLDACPGDRVLDACAAPGGKAAHILELCGDCKLDALDIDPGRLEATRETFTRLGLQARCLSGDAADPAGWWDGGAYDRILVDAPCTASGVIRRHPDIKLLRRASDVEDLRSLQARILDGLWQTLQPGGRMIYATCSVFREENDGQIAAFVNRTADAASQAAGGSSDWGREQIAGRQILPGDAGMDGFYYACLTKSP
jgi:16S rRNA (cytosine967-C5)-methyltransferase